MIKPVLLDEQLCFSIYRAQKAYNHFLRKGLETLWLNLSTIHRNVSIVGTWDNVS